MDVNVGRDVFIDGTPTIQRQDRFLFNILRDTTPIIFQDRNKLISRNDFGRYNYNSWMYTLENTKYSRIKKQLARAGFLYDDAGNVKCFYCGYFLPDPTDMKVGDDVSSIPSYNHNNCCYTSYMNHSRPKQFFGYDSLRYESERLETFIDWPNRYVSPFDLAESGFFYLRSLDHCACIFCGGIIGHFEEREGISVAQEHARHFNCPFVNSSKPVGNVPMKQCVALHYLTADKPYYASPPPRLESDFDYEYCIKHNKVLTGPSRAIGSLSNRLKKAMSQTIYIDINDDDIKEKKSISKATGRTRTFTNKWPKKLMNPYSIAPSKLSKAGFFYSGVGDTVTCFSCMVHFRNWELTDNPIKEHHAASPSCAHISSVTKLAFRKSNLAEGRIRKTAKYLGYRHAIDNHKVLTVMPTLMESDVIRAILHANVEYGIVFKILYFKIKRTGVPFFTVHSFFDEMKYHLNYPSSGIPENLIDVFQLPTPSYHSFSCTSCPYCSFNERFVFDRNEETRVTEKYVCKICYNDPATIIYLPCRHLICCAGCNAKLGRNCPMCRTFIEESKDIKYAGNFESNKVINLPCTHIVDKFEMRDKLCSSCFTITRAKRYLNGKMTDVCTYCKKSGENVLFLPCLHARACQECAKIKPKCQICVISTESFIVPIRC